MKQKGLIKRLGAVLLITAMTVSTFPQFSTLVFAEEKANVAPTVEQFATVEQLKSFNTDDNDGTKNPAKIYFGGHDQQWWIAGSQQENGLTLFAKSPLETGQQFEPDWESNKTYSNDWMCTYLKGFPTEVYSNHYGASPLRTAMKNLETTYFSNAQQNLMNTTTIYTNDTLNNSVYSTTDKLYLAYGEYDNPKYITVGTNSSDSLNTGLRVDMDYWGNRTFWLRTPDPAIHVAAFAAEPETMDGVYYFYVLQPYALMPAFELDLSSVLFASAVPAVSSSGQIQTSDTYTLRYRPQTSFGTATISKSKHSLIVNGVTNDSTYLVVQNKDGAWSKKVSSNDLVFADEMSDTLTSFENCEVWLETTDTDDRITYAQKTTQGTGHNVQITAGENMIITSNNGIQTNILGSIENIIVKANDDYIFPADYTVEEQSGIKVTRDSENQITVSGTPTVDVNMTLPQPTKKVYDMALEGRGTFTETCVGYKPISANEFTIKNNGNVDLEKVNISIIGNDADKFGLSWDNTTTIQPNRTIVVTIKPKDNLPVNTYQARLSVTADKVNAVTTDLQFIVSEHDYNAVVTPPTCTEKGYTTYTCKNCSHSYVGNEVEAKGHTFGEWEVIESPTCEQSGSRKHTCTDCGYSETENLTPNGHSWKDDYTVDKEPTCTEDGSKSIHCKNCNAVKDSTSIAKLGHSFTNYVSDGNATCTKDGTKTAKCDRCDETDTIVDVGTMLEHEYEWVFNNDATCEKNGTETGTCKHCQTTVTREKVDTLLGHEFNNYVSDENATCIENGTETAKCERCDKTDTRVIENSALGHKLGEWEVIKEPTTAETGTKERLCERCDYKETEIIPMITDEQPTYPTNPEKPDTDKPNSDKGSPETGDQINVGLFTALLSMSALGIAILAVLKKRNALEYR